MLKPQRFEIGQAVTPVGRNWKDAKTRLPESGPRFGEIYHVSSYHESDLCLHCGAPCCYLSEWPTDWFCQESFDPIETTTEEITALLEEPQVLELASPNLLNQE